MAQVTVTINSREYAVACEDGQEVRILQLSRLLDEKARMITGGSLQVNENMLLAMVGLILADELTELKKGRQVSESAPSAVDVSATLAETDTHIAAQFCCKKNRIIVSYLHRRRAVRCVFPQIFRANIIF